MEPRAAAEWEMGENANGPGGRARAVCFAGGGWNGQWGY